MKVGDLVKFREKYWHPDDSYAVVGLVLEHDPCDMNCNYRIRWSNHLESQRVWYSFEELIVLNCK